MIKRPNITIIDYGLGNLYSLIRALEYFGIRPAVAEEPEQLGRADGLILPGVGSFGAGMRGLKMRGLVNEVRRLAEKNKPMLGICLGAQLMLTQGHEFGIFKGLDIIKGEVKHFPPLEKNEKTPQVGWNTICPGKVSWQNTIFQSFNQDSRVYFVHSYILEPEDDKNILALTDYGGHTFCSAIKRGNLYGCQFHPEKSGQAGLKIIDNFIKTI